MPIAALVGTLVGALGEWALSFLVGLGVSFVSYEFSSKLFDYMLGYIRSTYYQFDSDLLGLLGLAGVPEGLNIIFGAFNVCVGLFAAGKSMKFMGSKKK